MQTWAREAAAAAVVEAASSLALLVARPHGVYCHHAPRFSSRFMEEARLQQQQRENISRRIKLNEKRTFTSYARGKPRVFSRDTVPRPGNYYCARGA